MSIQVSERRGLLKISCVLNLAEAAAQLHVPAEEIEAKLKGLNGSLVR